VTIDEDWDVMGQRATVSGTATFDQVLVDPALVVRYANAFEVPQHFGARSQLVHTSIQVGIAGGALRDAREFVRTKARPFFEATRAGWAESAATDPHTIHRFGRLAIQVAAAEALLASAAATVAEVTRFPRNAEAAARGSIAVAEAKAFASDTAVEVASVLFSLAGGERSRRTLPPVQALAERLHARQPRPRRLEVSPCRQLPAQRRPPSQLRAALR
jgi:alkylation response protein AidB-like acyl-CoA dehydrogenase